MFEELLKLSELNEVMKDTKAQMKGALGEAVFDIVARVYLGRRYHIIKNVVLQAPDGTTQIDLVVVSNYGFFVIEVKNFKGWIFGKAKDDRRTQALYHQKNAFQNPLRQNYKHIKALQSLLNLPYDIFKSLVVFSGEVQFKSDMPENVVRGGEHYIDYIKKFQRIVLIDDDVERYVKMISGNRLSGREHKDNIKRMKRHSSAPDENAPPVCPRCGKEMVLRTAAQGKNKGNKFWGCSGFPKCRHILNISS